MIKIFFTRKIEAEKQERQHAIAQKTGYSLWNQEVEHELCFWVRIRDQAYTDY